MDADYVGNVDGYIFTLSSELICWRSTLQSVITMSATEVESMVVGEAAKEALWLSRLVEEIGLNQGGVQLRCDRQSVFYLAKHWIYLVVSFHKIRELIVTEEIFLDVHTSKNASDMLMKLVTKDKFKHCLDLVNVCSL